MFFLAYPFKLLIDETKTRHMVDLSNPLSFTAIFEQCVNPGFLRFSILWGASNWHLSIIFGALPIHSFG